MKSLVQHFRKSSGLLYEVVIAREKVSRLFDPRETFIAVCSRFSDFAASNNLASA